VSVHIEIPQVKYRVNRNLPGTVVGYRTAPIRGVDRDGGGEEGRGGEGGTCRVEGCVLKVHDGVVRVGGTTTGGRGGVNGREFGGVRSEGVEVGGLE